MLDGRRAVTRSIAIRDCGAKSLDLTSNFEFVQFMSPLSTSNQMLCKKRYALTIRGAQVIRDRETVENHCAR